MAETLLISRERDCMTCPYCNGEMEKGELRHKGGLYFIPDGEETPLLYTKREMNKHKAVHFPMYSLKSIIEYPAAHICRNCSKIVIDY